MTVRVPTCSAMRIHLRRPYFSRPSTKRACSWADQRPAFRFRVTVSPGRGRRCVSGAWSTPAVAQARANPSMWVCVALAARAKRNDAVFSRASKTRLGRYTGFELRLVGGAVAAQGQLRLDFGATTGAYILGAAPEVVGSFQCQHAIILAMLSVRGSVGHETFRTHQYPQEDAADRLRPMYNCSRGWISTLLRRCDAIAFQSLCGFLAIVDHRYRSPRGRHASRADSPEPCRPRGTAPKRSSASRGRASPASSTPSPPPHTKKREIHALKGEVASRDEPTSRFAFQKMQAAGFHPTQISQAPFKLQSSASWRPVPRPPRAELRYRP